MSQSFFWNDVAASFVAVAVALHTAVTNVVDVFAFNVRVPGISPCILTLLKAKIVKHKRF